MAGTRVEALSRLDVQRGIQQDLFAKAERQLTQRRLKERGFASAQNMRLHFAHSGFVTPKKPTGTVRQILRAVVLSLTGIIALPLVPALLG